MRCSPQRSSRRLKQTVFCSPRRQYVCRESVGSFRVRKSMALFCSTEAEGPPELSQDSTVSIAFSCCFTTADREFPSCGREPGAQRGELSASRPPASQLTWRKLLTPDSEPSPSAAPRSRNGEFRSRRDGPGAPRRLHRKARTSRRTRTGPAACRELGSEGSLSNPRPQVSSSAFPRRSAGS